MGKSFAPSPTTSVTPAPRAPAAADRRQGLGNAAMQERLKAATSTADATTLDELMEARTFQPGKVRHTPPEKADSAIEEVLGAWLGGKAKGKAITGQVAVVGNADFAWAGREEHGPGWEANADRITGFEGDSRYWIHADRGDPGTMIHEGIHARAHDALGNTCQPLNEGVTEYFARKVCEKKKIAVRASYQDNYLTARAIAAAVGEDVLARALFDGDAQTLHDKLEARKPGCWDRLVDAALAGRWVEARRAIGA